PFTTLKRSGRAFSEICSLSPGPQKMSSFQTSLPTELAGNEPLSLAAREYFRARLRNRLYDLVVRKYADKQRTGKVTQRDLAQRIRRRPEVINRLLASPGNWTIDTVSDLLLAIGPEELDMSTSSIVGRPPRNEAGNSALHAYYDEQAKQKQEGSERFIDSNPWPTSSLIDQLIR